VKSAKCPTPLTLGTKGEVKSAKSVAAIMIKEGGAKPEYHFGDIGQPQCHKCAKGQKMIVNDREESHGFLSF